MLNSIILFLLLFGTWLLLSGIFTPLFLSIGAVSCFLAVIISIKTKPKNVKECNLAGFMLRLPLYLVWLLKELVVSGVDVSKRMWQIEPEISPSIAWLPTNLRDDLSLTAYGNSITITPGTMTTGITSEGMVQVHALTEEAMEGLRSGDMAKRVANLVNYKE